MSAADFYRWPADSHVGNREQSMAFCVFFLQAMQQIADKRQACIQASMACLKRMPALLRWHAT